MDRDALLGTFDLTDRVAIITGGSRGIGRATAHGFAALGARVVIASRKAEACDHVAAEVVAAGGQALAVPTHVGDPEALAHLVARRAARRSFGDKGADGPSRRTPGGIPAGRAASCCPPVAGCAVPTEAEADAEAVAPGCWSAGTIPASLGWAHASDGASASAAAKRKLGVIVDSN